ncbi:energy transducer TonB, partial [Brucella abortus]
YSPTPLFPYSLNILPYCPIAFPSSAPPPPPHAQTRGIGRWA